MNLHIKKIIYYFSNSDHNSPINQLDEKIGTSLVANSMCLFQSIFCFSLKLYIDSIVTGSMFILSISILFLLKYSFISEKFFSRAQSLIFFIGILGGNIDAGMGVNPSMIWIPLMSFIIIILLGVKEGLIWNFFICSIFYCSMYIAKKYNFNLTEFNSNQWFIIGSSNLITAPLTAAFMFSYFYKKKNDQYEKQIPLIEMGKSTSFLLHEISKPISRIKNAPTQEDIEQVVNIFTLANSINSNQSLIIKSKIDFKILIEEIISEYNEFIDYYNISIKIPNNHAFIHTNRELITIVIKNLIKNSIENNIQNKLEMPIAIDFSEVFFKISNSLLDENIQEEEILKPGYTTKNGNMGMGMMIVTGILKKLNHKFKTEIDRKNKIVSFTIIF